MTVPLANSVLIWRVLAWTALLSMLAFIMVSGLRQGQRGQPFRGYTRMIGAVVIVFLLFLVFLLSRYGHLR
jgi:Na+/melibiose symporter-like transporter